MTDAIKRLGLDGNMFVSTRAAALAMCKEILNLDISYTDAPKDAKMTPWQSDWFVSFWPLAALAYPPRRKEALEEHQPRQSGEHQEEDSYDYISAYMDDPHGHHD